MKKMIALTLALLMVLSLTACFGNANNSDSTSDQSNAADVSTYKKDFEGLQKYISDRNSNAAKAELYYDLIGADNGVRYVLNNNAYVEIYDFSSTADATADSANATAKAILEDIKDDGMFKPFPDSTEMTAVITASGKYVLAWDASRSFKYTDDSDKTAGVASTELIENW